MPQTPQLNPVQQLLGTIEGPTPLLSSEREAALTTRQGELLDNLEALFGGDGFAQYSMADLAKQLRCSLKTLYTLAPSRDELVLMVVDRHLRTVGKNAADVVEHHMSPLESLRTFHAASSVAIGDWSTAFARDIRQVASAQRVADGHERYMTDISVALLDAAVEAGEIRPVNTVAFAHAIGHLGAIFTQSETIAKLDGSPKEALDEVVDVLLTGLRTQADNH